jgi:hypothetical protein
MTQDNPSPNRPTPNQSVDFTVIFDDEEPGKPGVVIPVKPMVLHPPPKSDPSGSVTIAFGDDEEEPGSGQPKAPSPPSS